MVAEMLVCAQALWVGINCLCRVATGLPITMVELNVVIHVVCSVAMYAFWWRKPHDVNRPLSLTPQFLDKRVSALLHVMSRYGEKPKASTELPGPEPTPAAELEALWTPDTEQLLHPQ